MKIFPEYQSNNYQFPRVADPTKKDKEYFLAIARAIYSSQVNNRCGLSLNTVRQITENRLYSQASQSEEIFKEYFFPQDNNPEQNLLSDGIDTGGGTLTSDARAAARKGWMHVFWDIMSPAPKSQTVS